MPISHCVRQGEHVSALAERYGFASYATIWDDSSNAALRALRGDPNLLLPGDVVSIPDRLERQEPASTGARHRFVVQSAPLSLIVRLQDLLGDDIAGATCEVNVEGTVETLTSDAAGTIAFAIPRGTRRAELALDGALHTLSVGALDPADSPTGVRARLGNLGYYPMDAGEHDPDALRLAIELFQRDHGLHTDGEPSDALAAALRDAYGC